MYQDTQTRVKTRRDTTEYFYIEVGLHQGLRALSPLLFIIVTSILTRATHGLLSREPVS